MIAYRVQVLAGLQYSLPAPEMGLSQQQTHWVLAALAAQGQQQLQGSCVSAALALSQAHPAAAAAAGLFGQFPASQLQARARLLPDAQSPFLLLLPGSCCYQGY